MLEFALRQERLKYAKLLSGDDKPIPELTDLLKDDGENLSHNISQQRIKPAQSVLVDFLEEIGYDDIFNESEVNEIKQLFDKTKDNITQQQKLLQEVTNI